MKSILIVLFIYMAKPCNGQNNPDVYRSPSQPSSITYSLPKPKSQYKIIVKDVPSFFYMIDSLKNSANLKDSINYINNYMTRGNATFKYYQTINKISSNDYLNMITLYGSDLLQIKKQMKEFSEKIPEIALAYKKFKQYYENVKIPEVELYIGVLKGSVTINSEEKLGINALLTHTLSAEKSLNNKYLKDSTIAYNEVSAFIIKKIVELNMTHINKDLLLNKTISEGAVVYIISCLLGEEAIYNRFGISGTSKEYFENNEDKILKLFFKEVKGVKSPQFDSKWITGEKEFGNQLNMYKVVGYSIVKKYFEKSEDKQLAMKNILQININTITSAK